MAAMFFFVVALVGVLFGSAAGGTPCDGVLCTCTAGVARCEVKPEYDLDTYSINKEIHQLIVRAPVDTMCQALKRKFPRARKYQCDTGAKAGNPAHFTGSTVDTRHITAAVERVTQAAQSGELTSPPFGVDSHSTSPITTATAPTSTSITVETSTAAELTTPINKPSWMVVKKTPKGHESWCRIRSAHCECDACARKCPCATPPPTVTPEKCTPQIIWISPSPPNATSPAPPTPFTTPHPPTTPAIQSITTTKPTPLTRPKCDFYEAARTVLDDKERFERLCQTYAPNLYTPSTPVEAALPATSSLVELTTNAIIPTTATTTTSSALSTPTDAVKVASVIHRESAKLVQRDIGDGVDVSDGDGDPNPTEGSVFVVDEDLAAKVDRLTVTVNQIAEAVQLLADGVARLEAAVARVEQYLDNWGLKVWDWGSQSGSNLFTFIVAYCVQWLLRYLTDRYRRGPRPRQIQMRVLPGPGPEQPAQQQALPGPAQIPAPVAPAQVSEHRFAPDSSTLRSTNTGVVYSVPPAGAATPASVAPPPPPRNDMAVVLKRMDAMSADQQALFDGIADMHQNLMNFTGDSLVGGGVGPGASGSNRTYQGYNSPGERDRSMRHAYGTAGRGVQRSASGLGQSSSVVPQHRGGASGTVDARDEFEDMLL